MVHLVFRHTSKAWSCVDAGASTALLCHHGPPLQTTLLPALPAGDQTPVHSPCWGKHRHRLLALSIGGAGSDDSLTPATLRALLLLFICVVAVPGNIPWGRETFPATAQVRTCRAKGVSAECHCSDTTVLSRASMEAAPSQHP